MRTSEILRAARALIDTPEKLQQTGIWYSTDRSSYCSLAAIAAVATGQRRPCSVQIKAPASRPAVEVLARAAGTWSRNVDVMVPCTFAWSDRRPHGDVLAAFDTAIADAEAAEQEFACEPVPIPDRVAA